MPIIVHIDMNSYFATVEQQSNPFLRGKPICVAGKASSQRTVCAALSKEAKKMGCKGPMPVWEAKQICPSIIVVEADFEKYQFISREVFKILENYTPLIEIFSIDEAFLDLTNICKNTQEACGVIRTIKNRIKAEIGDYLTCSAGVSHNKLLAKLASEMQKPDGLTIIDQTNLPEIMQKTPIEDVCGIGRSTTHKLHDLSIITMSDLANCPLERLMNFFGPRLGKKLKLMGQGIDTEPVLPYYEYPAEKSYGHSYTLSKNIFSAKDTQKVLLKLAEKVGRRMRKEKVSGKTVSVWIRFFDFSSFGKQTTVTNFTNDGFEIYKIGLSIIEKENFTKPIRAVGVSVSNIKKSNEITPSFLNEDIKSKNALKSMDEINNRYGEFTVFRSSLSKIKDKVQNIPDGRDKRIMGNEKPLTRIEN